MKKKTPGELQSPLLEKLTTLREPILLTDEEAIRIYYQAGDLLIKRKVLNKLHLLPVEMYALFVARYHQSERALASEEAGSEMSNLHLRFSRDFLRLAKQMGRSFGPNLVVCQK